MNQSQSGLKKELKTRHMTMISIAGVIGAGLFVGMWENITFYFKFVVFCLRFQRMCGKNVSFFIRCVVLRNIYNSIATQRIKNETFFPHIRWKRKQNTTNLK